MSARNNKAQLLRRTKSGMVERRKGKEGVQILVEVE
jgi:hypothetical protein